MLLVIIIVAATWIMFVGPAFGMSTYGIYPIIPIILIMWVSLLSLAVRRLHDRNKSGWWLVPFYLVPNILFGFGNELGENPWAIALFLSGLALSLWALIEIGFLRGTPGENSYGPAPVQDEPPAV